MVELSRWAPEPAGADDPRALIARRFLTALVEAQQPVIEELLADPSTAPSYTVGGVASRGRPDVMRFVALHPGDATQVDAQFDLYYGTGCRESWLVHVVAKDDSLHVATVTRAAD